MSRTGLRFSVFTTWVWAPVQEKDKKFEKKFGPPQSDNICRGSGGILHQKMFEFRVSEMAFAAF